MRSDPDEERNPIPKMFDTAENRYILEVERLKTMGHGRPRSVFLSVIITVIVLMLPSTAGAVTFGSDLNAHQSNSNVTCGAVNIYQYAGRVGCSSGTSGNSVNPGDTSASHVIPFADPRANGDQYGTITQVTFKPAPGAPAGPARLSVVEYIRDANSTANPGLAQDIADSANFTMAPGADGLVHVATNLPARSLYNANDNSYRFDALFLSMLDNTTPIPADLNSTFLSGWISPYVDIPSSQGDLTVPLPADRQGVGCCGFGPYPFYVTGAWPVLGEVLMQAELIVNPNGGGGGDGDAGGDGGGAGDGQIGPLKFGNGRVVGNKVVLPVTCALDETCKGLLRLLSQGKNVATTAKKKRGKGTKKTVVYGRVKFKIPANKKRNIKVKLTKAGKKKLRRRTKVRLRVKATIGKQVSTATVTIKRKKSGRKKSGGKRK